MDRLVERSFKRIERRIGRLEEEDRRVRERIAAVMGASSSNPRMGTESSGTIIAGDGLVGGGALPGTVTLAADLVYILLYDSAGAPVTWYAPTSAGLDGASGDAAAGDVILVPAVTITGNHTLTADVSYVGISRFATILTGQITFSANSTIENLSITRTANDGNDLKGVVGAASGTGKVSCCDVTCTQAGAGAAYAINIENNGDIEVWNSYLNGDSTGGNGYASNHQAGSGNVYIHGGRAVGSTDVTNV